MTPTWIQVLAALGGLSFIGGIITAVAMWRKTRADAAAVLTDSAMSIIKDLCADLADTRSEMQALRQHMGTLEDLLRQRGIPVPHFQWQPHRNGVA